jgi:hypothetical protein
VCQLDVVLDTVLVFDVKTESACTFGKQPAGDSNNGSSLRRLEIFKTFFLAGHGNRAESIDPNSERVCVKAGPEWVRQECASRFEGVTDRVCFEATI